MPLSSACAISRARGPWSEYECRAAPPDAVGCFRPDVLGPAYVYLLGIYLGDGTLSEARRQVWRLRIFQDRRYPKIADEIAAAILVLTGRRCGQVRRVGCTEIYSNWKHWICLFPQHGPGAKHLRRISLRDWQQQLVERHPQSLLRGLVHSDGCRVVNRVRRPTKAGIKLYAYPRYQFTNASEDIRAIFVAACELAGIACRPNNERDLSVARRRSVEIMDRFIGPKA